MVTTDRKLARPPATSHYFSSGWPGRGWGTAGGAGPKPRAVTRPRLRPGRPGGGRGGASAWRGRASGRPRRGRGGVGTRSGHWCCASRRRAPLRGGPGPPGRAAARAEGAAEQELDLGIGAAHLVGGPLGEGVVDRRVEAQQYALAFGHQ